MAASEGVAEPVGVGAQRLHDGALDVPVGAVEVLLRAVVLESALPSLPRRKSPYTASPNSGGSVAMACQWSKVSSLHW